MTSIAYSYAYFYEEKARDKAELAWHLQELTEDRREIVSQDPAMLQDYDGRHFQTLSTDPERMGRQKRLLEIQQQRVTLWSNYYYNQLVTRDKCQATMKYNGYGRSAFLLGVCETVSNFFSSRQSITRKEAFALGSKNRKVQINGH